MITLEKMIFLKSVPLFKYTNDESLLTIASIAQQKIASENETIIRKGDLDNVMYMIVKGKMRVHDQEKELAQLGAREVVGELAALVPGKRTASVTAIEETLLLAIHHTDLYELMEADIGLVKGIISILCYRLKEARGQSEFL